MKLLLKAIFFEKCKNKAHFFDDFFKKTNFYNGKLKNNYQIFKKMPFL